MIIARTDARALEGLDAALERAGRYRDAGADMLFVEAPESDEEVAIVAEAFPDTPLLFNWLEGGKSPPVAHDRLRELGYRLIICPLSTLLAATAAVGERLASMRAAGTPEAIADDLPAFADLTAVVGLPDVERLEARFAAG